MKLEQIHLGNLKQRFGVTKENSKIVSLGQPTYREFTNEWKCTAHAQAPRQELYVRRTHRVQRIPTLVIRVAGTPPRCHGNWQTEPLDCTEAMQWKLASESKSSNGEGENYTMSNFPICTFHIILLRVVKSRNMTRRSNINRETISVYNISIGEPQRMRLLQRPQPCNHSLFSVRSSPLQIIQRQKKNYRTMERLR
jgi:hypothetical protein